MLKRALVLTALAVCLTVSPIHAQVALRGEGTMQIDIMPNRCPNNVIMYETRDVFRPTSTAIGPGGLHSPQRAAASSDVRR